MKYNNQYYKIIAKLLDESIDNKHHTDLYYSKKIAESYGETYTDLGNVNKYLRDFAKDVGVELDNKHHTRLWYLKRIADALYDGELEHNTENYYLKIISENIDDPTPPTPQIASVFLTSDKSILSYYDNESATLSATVLDEDNQPIKNKTVEFYKGTSSLGTAQTNDNGVAIKTYNSQGVGDISLTASADSITSETYSIEDCYYWNENGVSYNSTSPTDRRVLSGLETMEYTPSGDFEVSFTLEASTFGKRFYFVSKGQSTSTSNRYGFGGDIDTSQGEVTFRTTSSDNTGVLPRTNPMDFRFVVTGTTIDYYANEVLITTKTASWLSDYAPYVFSWGIWNTGSVSATNIKIKPLT